MNGTGSAIAFQFGQAKTFSDNTVSCKGSITMQEKRHNLATNIVSNLRLFRPGFAQNHRVHSFQMGRVCGQGQMDIITIKFPIRRCSQMVFHIAGAFHIFRICWISLKFRENSAKWLGHYIGQNIQTTPMRHPQNNFLNAQLTAPLDHTLHGWHKSLTTIKAKAFGPGIFYIEKMLKTFGFDQFLQNRYFSFSGKSNIFMTPFDPFLNPALLIRLLDMHELNTDGATICPFDNLQNFPDRCCLQP